ncbi:hypothetical protein [Gloeobacter violaceus]|uniref:hypothetical protein n=1 Tax=Gloeobacter violaceus TaxID=33072 RepID=UPI0002F379A3|nr:hypothetical protein [Gloeobacter violaceus]
MAEAVVGWPRGGLSGACLERYRELMATGVAPERIVVLAAGREEAQRMSARLEGAFERFAGPLRVETWMSFAVRMLAEFWGEVLGREPTLGTTFEPVVLDFALTRHCVERACALCPDHEARFENCGLKEERVWDQIASAAWIACTSGISLEAVGERLRAAWPDGEDTQRLALLGALSCCARRTRDYIRERGAIDAAGAVELFGRVVMGLDAFWGSFDHLVVDRAEDSCAVALDLFGRCQERGKGLFLAYTVGGGGLYTGVPQLAAEFVVRRTRFRYLDRPDPAGEALRWLADRIARRIHPEFKNPLPVAVPDPIPQPVLLEGQTVIDAAEAVAAAIRALLATGVLPGRIAVVAPLIDAPVATVIESVLGLPLHTPRPPASLLQQPLVRTLLSALDLAYPQWGRFPTFGEVRLMLGLLLDLDPVRAELLAADVFDPVGRVLRSREAVRYPERVGFEKLDRYQDLIDWLADNPQQDAPDCTLGRLYTDLLTEVICEPADQQLLFELMGIARRLRLSGIAAVPQGLGAVLRFAHAPPTRPPASDRLVFSTPWSYINQGFAADYQFWFDITSERWSRPSWVGLYNHRVLTPEWDGCRYDYQRDQNSRTRRLARTLFNLCCRTSRGLHLVRSALSARGEANSGQLDRLILSAAERAI